MNSYKVLNKQVFNSGAFSLVPIRFEDRLDIMNWRNEQIYHLRQAKPLTKNDQDSYFKNIINKLFEDDKPNQILFSFLKDGNCIGYGGLVHINWIDKNAEISFIMETKLEEINFNMNWSMFLTLIKQLAFDELNLHKIYTYAFDLRPHLYTCLENNDFIKESELKEHCRFDGEYKNVIIHSYINKISLRKANSNDIDLTYKWANEKKIREYSFSKEEIIFDKHKIWFLKKINDHDCNYYIVENCLKTALGSIRIDKNEFNQLIISYLLDPKFHGNGYGLILLKLLENEVKLFKNQENLELLGLVQSENIPSLKIFRKLNYKESIIDNIHNFTKQI